MGLLSGPVNLVDVKGALEGVGSLATSIRSAITGDVSPEKKAELEALTMQLSAKANEGQMAINQVEAGHPSIFVSGPRPAIMWVCAIGMAWQYIMGPVLDYGVRLYIFFSTPGWNMASFPTMTLNVQDLIPIVLSLLGLGGMRSWEKSRGVARN